VWCCGVFGFCFGGFAGVVAVFRSSDRFNPEEVRRVIFLVLVCASVVVASLLPSALLDLGLPELMVIKVSSVVLGIAALVLMVSFLASIIQGQIKLLFPRATVLLVGSFFATSAVLLTAVFTPMLEVSFGLILIGELVFILAALWIFGATLLWVKDI
jgi:ABC-type uncharacterized transport system permease subunit